MIFIPLYVRSIYNGDEFLSMKKSQRLKISIISNIIILLIRIYGFCQINKYLLKNNFIMCFFFFFDNLNIILIIIYIINIELIIVDSNSYNYFPVIISKI